MSGSSFKFDRTVFSSHSLKDQGNDKDYWLSKTPLERMAAGDVLVIECTDPLTTIDIPNLLRETGDVLEDSARKGKVLTFRIRKNEVGSGGRLQPKEPARNKSK